MSLDKFTMQTVDQFILDATVATARRYHKRPDKDSTCNSLNVSTETGKMTH